MSDICFKIIWSWEVRWSTVSHELIIVEVSDGVNCSIHSTCVCVKFS